METEWDSLLLEAGIDIPFGTEQFNILCPFHSDNVASCSINIGKGVWICHAGCGQGSLKYFLSEVLQISLDEVEALIQKPIATFDIHMFDYFKLCFQVIHFCRMKPLRRNGISTE